MQCSPCKEEPGFGGGGRLHLQTGRDQKMVVQQLSLCPQWQMLPLCLLCGSWSQAKNLGLEVRGQASGQSVAKAQPGISYVGISLSQLWDLSMPAASLSSA